MLRNLIMRLNPGTRRRWRIFFQKKRAIFGLIVLGLALFFSLTAEIWSNKDPLLLIRTQVIDGKEVTKFYFPAFFNYSVEEFGIEDSFVVNYQELLESDKQAGIKTRAFFALNPYSPETIYDDVLAAPSAKHLLGTDSLGRDVLARLIYGLRTSLSFAVLYWLGVYILGIFIGSLQGYFGGMFDFITERFKEILEIMPVLMLVILVTGLVRAQTFWIPLAVLLVFSWMSVAGQLRAQFLSLRKREFCEAAIAMGGGAMRIIFKHLLPNGITPILTMTPFVLAAGIASLTSLDYLGFGLPPPTPSLGEMLKQGRDYIMSAPWLILAPTVVLVVLLVAINWLGEALRAAFDPRA